MDPESRAQLKELKQDLADDIISESGYLELKTIILSAVKSNARGKNAALPEPAPPPKPTQPSETSPGIQEVLNLCDISENNNADKNLKYPAALTASAPVPSTNSSTPLEATATTVVSASEFVWMCLNFVTIWISIWSLNFDSESELPTLSIFAEFY